MIHVDLHTHSIASPDGGLDEDDYWDLLMRAGLDAIAITDHGSIEFATYLKSKDAYKDSIIVGQEVMSSDGEIIGLFLKHRIADGHTPEKTVSEIKKQRGVVLIPHPADAYRSGLSFDSIQKIADKIDGIEARNGRTIRRTKEQKQIEKWAARKKIPLIASSDAHSRSGAGRTYTTLPAFPAHAKDLRSLLKVETKLTYRRPPLRAFFAPKLNRLRNKMVS